MTAEMNRLMNDPNFVVQFAVGDPFPALVPQNPASGIRFAGIYFQEPKRYVLKKAHMTMDDNRVFEHSSGRLVYNSHHPGKNPYDAMDPLGLTNQGNYYQVMGAEWNSICDVTGHLGFPSFKIRPKKMSMHGRQYVRDWNNNVLFNIGKMSKLKTMSLRPHLAVCRGDSDDTEYQLIADMMGRTLSITNEKEELVATMAKTSKALIMNAAFGAGSESTIDVAPGVDVSVILGCIFGLQQVGAHVANDVVKSYVASPLQSAVVDNVVGATGLEGAVNMYSDASNSAFNTTNQMMNVGNFVRQNFFS